MRSRSTLLSHILGSHGEICGYKELHLSYTGKLSFLKMKVALAESDNFNTCHYLLDKALHNKLVIDTDIFNDDLKVIMLLREPNGTISSMFKMHQKLNKNANYMHLVQYYRDRLQYMNEFAKQHENKYLFVDSENLVLNPDAELDKITQYLALDTPIQQQYKQFSETGIAGSGDPSENIKAGEIIQTENVGASPNLSRDELDLLIDEYQYCRERLMQCAIK